MQEQLLTKTVTGTALAAAIVAALGIPIWGFAPLVLVAAAFLAAAAVGTILFPPQR